MEVTSPMPARARAMRALAWLALIAAAALALARTAPPDVVTAGSAADAFSAERALVHVRRIAAEPHPLGSAANLAVRDYLVAQLRELGLDTTVQETVAFNPRPGLPLRGGTVRNIVARLPGTRPGKALLLSAHYDSVPTGPGASDDAAAVAAILETVRALRAGPPLSNDLLIVLTDGEEAGLLGAIAFAEQHPWARDVGLVLNFEARGTSGPSIMFETSPGNGQLIQTFAAHAPRPIATSLAYEIYKVLPNDTDLTIFKEAGLAGLNFSYIGGLTDYHTALDSVERLDLRSLQHHGESMLALARGFGASDLSNLAADDAVYFDVLGALVIHYPAAWALPLALIAAGLFLALAFARRGRPGALRHALIGAGAFLLSLAAAAGVGLASWELISVLNPEYAWLRSGDTYNDAVYLAGAAALVLAMGLGWGGMLARRYGELDVLLGVQGCWVALALITAIVVPGASYLFALPALASLLGAAAAARYPALASLLPLAAIPAAVLLTPIILMVAAALALPGAWVALLLMAAGLSLCLPLALAPARRRWAVPAAGLAVWALCLAIGSLTDGWNADQRQPDSLLYGLDADTRQAVWIGIDPGIDAWNGQFLTGGEQALPQFFPYALLRDIPLYSNPAPAADLPAPQVTVLSQEQQGDTRRLELRITPGDSAAAMTGLYFEQPGAVLAATVNGRPLDEASLSLGAAEPLSLEYFAPPPAGLTVTLSLRGAGPIGLRIVEGVYGLPHLAGQPAAVRPPEFMPSQYGPSDLRLITRRVEL